MCVKGSLVLVLVLDRTQCLPQGVGTPPAMLRGRTAGFPKSYPSQSNYLMRGHLRRYGMNEISIHLPKIDSGTENHKDVDL